MLLKAVRRQIWFAGRASLAVRQIQSKAQFRWNSASNREFLPFVVSLGSVNMLGLRQGRMDDAEFPHVALSSKNQVK